MSWLSKRAPKAIENPEVQAAALKGAKAVGKWLWRKIRGTPKVSIGPPEIPITAPVKMMPRVECPLCGRDVAVTSEGITFIHRTRPGTRDTKHHRVRLLDGAEV